MALLLSGAPEALFNRWGSLGSLPSLARSYQASLVTAMTSTTTGIVSHYNSEPDIQALMGAAWIGLANAPGGGVGGIAQAIAGPTVNRMVYRDNPQLAQTLEQLTVLVSLREVIRQMKQQGATIRAHTLAATVGAFQAAAGSSDGRGRAAVSLKRPSDGLILQNAYAEKVRFTVTGDSYLSGATEGNERLEVSTTGQQSNLWAHDWPLGSDATLAVNAVDGEADDSSGNLQTNSGWDEWTSGEPDNWEVIAGGSLISEETSIIFGTEGSSLKITGDGTAVLRFRQLYDDADGTTGELEPLTQYAHNLWLRQGGGSPVAGTLRVALTDASGNVIADAAGTPNSSNISLSGNSTTSWTGVDASFRTPHVMPTAVYLEYLMTVALTSGGVVYLDRGSVGLMEQLYRSGPYVAAFSGADPFTEGDLAEAVITNTRGAGGSLDTFQTLLARLFPEEVYNEQLIFPYSSSPSISDSLIA